MGYDSKRTRSWYDIEVLLSCRRGQPLQRSLYQMVRNRAAPSIELTSHAIKIDPHLRTPGDTPTVSHLPGQSLEGQRRVFAVDMRNHGSSSHHDSMTYEDMTKDVLGFLADQVGRGRLVLVVSPGGVLCRLRASKRLQNDFGHVHASPSQVSSRATWIHLSFEGAEAFDVVCLDSVDRMDTLAPWQQSKQVG